jgi:hypothetical protein
VIWVFYWKGEEVNKVLPVRPGIPKTDAYSMRTGNEQCQNSRWQFACLQAKLADRNAKAFRMDTA